MKNQWCDPSYPAVFQNIATCFKELLETGGATLETTVMTSLYLADSIIFKKKKHSYKTRWYTTLNVDAFSVVRHLFSTHAHHVCQQEPVQALWK